MSYRFGGEHHSGEMPLSWYGVRDNLTDVNEDHLAKVAFDRFVH
jgi:hypothetical protein